MKRRSNRHEGSAKHSDWESGESQVSTKMTGALCFKKQISNILINSLNTQNVHYDFRSSNMNVGKGENVIQE